MKPDSTRLFLFDGAVIALVSAAICVASHQLLFMTIFVPAVIAARLLATAVVGKAEGVNMAAEVLFLAVCTALGAFNDWNSVCNKKIYDYAVPHYFDFTTIPIWMLLFWGMILRFIARFARWEKLGPPERVSNSIGLGRWRIDSAPAKVIAQLLLVFATRNTIYRFYLDPLFSWLPFLGALIVYLAFFSPTRHDFKLLAAFMVGGPLIEILYIQVGDLHYYHLGWLGGVPLWIALWWLVIILVWKDLAFRIEQALRRVFANFSKTPA